MVHVRKKEATAEFHDLRDWVDKIDSWGQLKRFLKLEDDDLLSKIYDYHQRAETPDGRIDTGLAAEVIRDFRQAEGVAREISVGQVFDFSYLEPLR